MGNKFFIMSEGGKRLGAIKSQLAAAVKAGVSPREIDALADKLIRSGGDKPSFKMVDGYQYATCINVNEGMVHGIPSTKPLKEGDVVKVDVGLFHDGFHLDTSVTVQIPPENPEVSKFLQISRQALDNAIFAATAGNSVYDLSLAMETTIEAGGYSVIRDLTGHGIGRKLHMTPYIPCFTDSRSKKDVLAVDQTIAIEIMASMGDYHLVEASDGWTLSTQDGSITAMFEETVYISPNGPIILTKSV